MVLRCEGSEAYAGAAWPVGMCARRAERLADKQSVTGPLSHAGIEGHAYSSARDKVSHDETDEQHWWRLRMISHRSPSGLFARSHFPLPPPSQPAFSYLSATVSSVYRFSLLHWKPFGMFKHFCLPGALLAQGHISFNEGKQAMQETSFTACFYSYTPRDTHTQASKQLLDLDTLHCTVMSTDS